MALSSEERHEIEEEMAIYADPRAAVVDALKIVQRHRGGWVSDEAVSELSQFMGMTETEVDSVASFYNIVRRRPVGRHVILLCDSVSCWLMGYTNLYHHLSESLGIRFGETTADGRFTLLPNACLGCCDKAPAMMVDDDLYVQLDAAAVDRALANYQ